MAQPATGTTWNSAGLNDLYSSASERGGLQAIIIRDNRGDQTDISPFANDLTTVAWSPFAQDGYPRKDLFATRLVGGRWQTVQTPNEGFFYIGAQTEDGGAERDPKTDNDDLKILQSNYPYDSVITNKSKTLHFVAVDTLKPLIHRLEADLPLTDEHGQNLVPDIGEDDYFYGTPLDTATVDRQIIALFSRSIAGKPLFRAELVPLCRLDSQAAKKRTKTDPDTADLTYKYLPDPFFMIPDPRGGGQLVPGYDGAWISGPGWLDAHYVGS